MSDLEVLKEVEKIITKKLKPCPADKDILGWGVRNTYLLNANQQVIGLNLSDNNLSDLAVLKALPNLTSLNLSGNQLSDLTVLKSLPNLASLNLSNNQLSDLKVLKALQNLIALDLSYNNLSDLKVLKALPNLIALDLSHNNLSDLTVLKGLPNLASLNLSGNQLSDLTVLKALPNNLTELDLSHNNLSDLTVLKVLPNLTTLNLGRNPLNDISILKELKNLTQLNLWGNELDDISVLKKLKKLTALSLAGNKIKDIEVLKDLNNISNLCLGDNQLKILPEWLLGFNLNIKLDSNGGTTIASSENAIYVENNPLEEPPLEIIKQGNAAIRAYFEQLKKEGVDYIYEAKLILVGEGGAGKTSLANKIINPDWQLIPETKSESTKGIDILSYSFPYKDKTFRVNIWDFGGQEIYHQTHQFFLSKRALYFLLTDDRKEDTDFYHWLNIVDLLSANSPVLIIKNEKSNRSRDIPEQELKEFNNIQKILATDLSDNRGLLEIVKALQYYITDLPHIGSPLPKTWVKVREQLEQDSRYYIDLKEYFAICQANGFEKEADKLQLSEYLHDLGVCLHFQNHPLLLKTLILKPTWATDAVYKVLDNDTVKNQAGHFNDKDLADIWQAEEYNTMRGELLALMQKFKLCYEIRNQPQHYIAPQLLKDKAPQYDWQTNDNLLLRYKYDFMPKGILSQFIVEMHEYITSNYKSVWKSGVILDKENTQAEIIEYYGKREIHIRVYGQNKKELLTIISHELDRINGSYERLRDKCKKLIPCNCENCKDSQEPHFYDHEKLKERISHRKYTIECGNPPYANVDILKLVEDIERDKIINESTQTGKTIINIDTGDKTMTGENKTINVSGGAFIEGGVKVENGDFVTGDKIVNNNSQGMSKEDFLMLLQALKQDLPNSGLPDDELESVSGDIQAVEEQLKKDAPKKSIVSSKLTSINSILEDASQTVETVEKGKEVFEKVVGAVKTLISVISAASFFI